MKGYIEAVSTDDELTADRLCASVVRFLLDGQEVAPHWLDEMLASIRGKEAVNQGTPIEHKPTYLWKNLRFPTNSEIKLAQALKCPQTMGGTSFSHIHETLRKDVQMRNQVVHGRATTITYETLQEILLTMRDVLWILDYCSGYA